MEILVIDGQGGGLGRQLVAAVKKAVPQAVVTAIGTNSVATSVMLKAGADRAATGENAVDAVSGATATSNAIIVGFNVRPDANAKDYAARMKVDMRMYRVIYDCINEIEAAMKGMLAPKFQEQIIGHVEIRQTFKVSKVGTVCGGYVTDGKIVRNSKVRVVRDNIVVFEGDLASLRRFKDDVKEVAAGYECGLQVDKYNDVKVGDVIEVYVMEEIKQ